MLHTKGAGNFFEYALNVFIPYIMSTLHNATRLDLGWDRCVQDSLEAMEITKSGKGIYRWVVAQAVILKNWQDFLQVDKNKTELSNFLTQALTFYENGKQLVITEGGSILSNILFYMILILTLHAHVKKLIFTCYCLQTVQHFVLISKHRLGQQTWTSLYWLSVAALYWLWTLGSICNKRTFLLPGCPPTGCCNRNENDQGIFCVSCSHWFWHCIPCNVVNLECATTTYWGILRLSCAISDVQEH